MKDESKIEILFEEIISRLDSIEQKIEQFDRHSLKSKPLDNAQDTAAETVLKPQDVKRIQRSIVTAFRIFFPELWPKAQKNAEMLGHKR